MPRNSSGTYSLPAGNPVVANTLIETGWANPTMSDIGTALTDSLDRNGRGGMLQPLKLANGAVAAPALSFTSETTTGLYRVSAGVIGLAIAGVLKASLAATGLTLVDPLAIPLGTVAAPGLAFSGDANTGLWSPAADTIALAAGGVEVMRSTNAAITLALATTASSSLTVTGALTANGNVALGDAAGDTLTIAPSAVTWSNNPTHSGNHTFSGNVTHNGATTLGDASGDALTINSNTASIPNGLNLTGGNVGIGGTPTQKLDVQGNIRTTGEIALSGADFVYSWAGGVTGQRRAGFYLDGTNQVVRVYTANAEIGRFDASGNAQIGTTASQSGASGAFTQLRVKGNVAGNIGSVMVSGGTSGNLELWASAASTECGLWTATSMPMTFGIGNVERFRIGTGGALTSTSTDGQIGLYNGTNAAGFWVRFQASGTDVGYLGNGLGLVSAGTSGQFALRGESDILFSIGSTKRLHLTSDGRFYGTALHNNGGSVTGTTNQYIASGTYTPTLAAGTNVATVTALPAKWTRVGNVVHVAFEAGTTQTASSAYPGTTSRFTATLPIASTLANTYDLAGSATNSLGHSGGYARADIVGNRAEITFGAISTGTTVWDVVFMYEVK